MGQLERASRIIYLFFGLIAAFGFEPHAAASGWLHTQGTSVLNDDNSPWLGRGVNLPDTRSNSHCWQSDNPNQVIQRLKLAANWGATFIRIPMDSQDAIYYNRTDSDITADPNYLSAIKSVVDYAATNIPNLYIELAIWVDPTLKQETYYTDSTGRKQSNHDGGYPTPAEDAVLNKLVDTFHAYPNVLFGISNEPQLVDPNTVWSAMNHGVQVIRTREALFGTQQHIVSVQGVNWSGNLSFYRTHPITAGNGSNVVYEHHIYDASEMQTIFDTAATLPVIVGEYGPQDPQWSNASATYNPYDWEKNCSPSSGGSFTLSQIAGFVQNLKAKGIPYLAWSFNECDGPNLLNVGSPGSATGCNTNPAIPITRTSWGEQVYQDMQTPWVYSPTTGGSPFPINPQSWGWLHTNGNDILDYRDYHFLGRGVVLPDPRSNSACWQSNNPNQVIARMQMAVSYGATLIRIPLDSTDAISAGKVESDITASSDYLSAIKAVVDYAYQNYRYLWIELSPWIDPTLQKDSSSLTFDGGYPTTAEDDVLNKLVDTFANYPNVIFGLASEPKIVPPATVWNAMNHAVQTVRNREQLRSAPSHLVAVQGTQWSSDLTYYHQNPIMAGGGNNIIYEYRVYDSSVVSTAFTTAKILPVIIGNYGPSNSGSNLFDWEVSCTGKTGNNFTIDEISQFQSDLFEKGIPHIAGIFNECEGPNMLSVTGPSGTPGKCNASAVSNPNLTTWGFEVQQSLLRPWYFYH